MHTHDNNHDEKQQQRSTHDVEAQHHGIVTLWESKLQKVKMQKHSVMVC